MSRNFVNLNVNPCKMCMPMGGVMALKGIENSMVILHGSQGCSTYIRRHMATHFNEPIDIASSSLSEEGTVYGGARNLKKGIKNMYKMYNPSLIAVLTTCLAETIGEDVKRIVLELQEEDKELRDIRIVPIPTPGYSGTQAEGYHKALRGLVEALAKDDRDNGKVNIVAENLTPADIRYLKQILEDFSIDYIMLPDISETLDSPYTPEYSRIPAGGTKIEDIGKMAGAMVTIEFGTTVDDDDSAGEYLKQKYGIPLYRCPIPTGLENCDIFFEILSKITRKHMPDKYVKERGRLLDAMIDAHKYNGEGRAVIFGEAEQCAALTAVCVENGITPVLIATGAVNEKFKSYIKRSVMELEEQPLIIDDVDFETIEKYAVEKNANLMLGNSDGRRIEEKHGIDLVRIGFPVHDRVGGQRKCTVSYFGTNNVIEETANLILSKKETSFREEAYDKYFMEKKVKDMADIKGTSTEKVNTSVNTDTAKSIIEAKTASHPCYNAGAHDYARMHIPVAPKCNISCNYCSRKYDCANESRPGVTSEVLTPDMALAKYKEVKAKVPNLKVLGIAGPGDALANFDEVKRSIEMIKEYDPEVTFCLSTNGLMLPFFADELIKLGVSHITITINTIDPAVGAKLYRSVTYLGQNLTGEEGAAVLLQNQLSGLRYLSSKGIVCKVNIVMVKGINDIYIPDTVKKVKECGAFITNIMQMIPVTGSAFEGMPFVSQVELNDMRKKCELDLKQMYHCKQCRADAIGTLAHDRSIEFRCESGGCSSKKDNVTELKPNAVVQEEAETAAVAETACKTESLKFAIATKTGINIDQHFGHSEEFHIYDYSGGKIKFLEKRNVNKYCAGPAECDDHDDKIQKIIKTIQDCDAVLAMRAGTEPIKKLEANGIKLFQMYEGINKGIEKAVLELKAC
jgi:nitrogenase cofactor biosynthesis protein NifB